MILFGRRSRQRRVRRTRAAFAAALVGVLSQTAWTSAQELTPNETTKNAAVVQEKDTPKIADDDSIRLRVDDTNVHWGRVIRQTLSMQAIQHSFFMTQPKARQALGGPWLHDWFQSASSPFVEPHWSDGGSFFVNYIAHPMAGSSYAYIYRQNDPANAGIQFGQKGYFAHLAKSAGVAALSSAQWEIGPMSEASLENVGMPPDRYKMAWVDFVITPTLGIAWTTGEDALDRFVIQKLERKIDSTAGRAAVRILLNPTRSMANVVAGQKPWKRPGRP